MAKKKRKVKVGLGFKIFFVTLVIVSLLLLFEILFLNVLNFLLLSVVVLGILFINIISFFLLIKSRKKKFGMIFSSLFIILFSFGVFYLDKTTDFFSNINIDYTTYNYSVVVMNDSDYEKLSDIEGGKLGYYDEESDENVKALKKVEDKVDIVKSADSDIHSLMNSLVSYEVDAILVEQSVLDILNENVVSDNTVFKG